MTAYKHDWGSIVQMALQRKADYVASLEDGIKELYRQHPILHKFFNLDHIKKDIAEFLACGPEEECAISNVFMLLDDECWYRFEDAGIELADDEGDFLLSACIDLDAFINDCEPAELPHNYENYLYEDSLVALHNIFNNADNLNFSDYSKVVNQRLLNPSSAYCKFNFDNSTFCFEPLSDAMYGEYVPSISFKFLFGEENDIAVAVVSEISYDLGAGRFGLWALSEDDSSEICAPFEDFKNEMIDIVAEDHHSPFWRYFEGEKLKARGLSLEYREVPWMDSTALVDYSEKAYRYGQIFIPKSVVAIAEEIVHLKRWYLNKNYESLLTTTRQLEKANEQTPLSDVISQAEKKASEQSLQSSGTISKEERTH